MIILAIDTSCDETSVAIAKDDLILANIIASQVKLHAEFGGVVPGLAQRAHRQMIDPAIHKALKIAGLSLNDIDAFAVTYGPGLSIALGVGIEKVKDLVAQYKKPLIAVNHMAGHIYANLAQNKNGRSSLTKFSYPLLALLVSGGHTELVLMSDDTTFKVIGATLDDAMGEAYDKVAKMLNLGYPGGPIIAELAKTGNPSAYPLPIPLQRSNDLNFSFSGLKTAVLYTIKRILAEQPNLPLTKKQTVDLAASFQAAAFSSIGNKLVRAVKEHSVKQVILGGGVIANKEFRSYLRNILKPYGLTVHYPNLKKLCTDNAAMIAVAAHHMYQAGVGLVDADKIDRDPVAEL